MNKLMYFQNAVFHSGMNVTVRRGDKWFGVEGEEIELVDYDTDAVLMRAYVRETMRSKFDDLDPDLIKIEQNPQCRTKEGLLSSLREVYEDFSPDEEVTVVRFEVHAA